MLGHSEFYDISLALLVVRVHFFAVKIERVVGVGRDKRIINLNLFARPVAVRGVFERVLLSVIINLVFL